jgi:hypothetical protein
MIYLNRIISLVLLCLFPAFIKAQLNYPADVKLALQQTTKNKVELETALNYFYTKGDSIEIKAINFLIANMPGHYSEDYYWVDSLNNKVSYSEEGLTTNEQIDSAVGSLKTKYGKIRPVTIRYKDLDTIKASLLIENVEQAFKAADKNLLINNPDIKSLFFEYILPYRVSTEPVQQWRKEYTTRFASLKTANKDYITDSSFLQIGTSIKSWFLNTYKVLHRTEPLPRLGPLQLLNRAKGPCEDIADLTAYMARSKGIPATIDFVPAWATASGSHCLNAIIKPDNAKAISYDVADGLIDAAFQREPSKVIRITYSKQPGTAFSILKDSSIIPAGFMRTENYIDVTKDYWQVGDVKTKLFPQHKGKARAAFACVWNYFNWRPVWYGSVDDNANTTFTNMAKGAVYLPAIFNKQQMIPVGWPVVSDYNQTIELKPDTLQKRQVIIEEQAKYLAFRQGKEYTLFYWANQWIRVATKKAENSITKLVFDGVPFNALLLLVPEYTQGKDRPFIVTKEGKRLWY